MAKNLIYKVTIHDVQSIQLIKTIVYSEAAEPFKNITFIYIENVQNYRMMHEISVN